MKALINGKIILKDRILDGCSVVFSEKTEKIVPSGNEPSDIEKIDCKNNFIVPGLIDLHIHGYLGKDVCDGDPESIKTISEGIAKNGVTGFLPTTMTVAQEDIERALNAVRQAKREGKDQNGAEILGVHSEGPFISPKKKGAQNEKFIQKPNAEFVKKHADIIKIITLAPETDENFEEIKKIKAETNVLISMGHTDASFETAYASVAAGVSHATHLFNAMSPLTSRAPGVVGAALKADVSCELIVDTFHVSPALYDMLYKLKGNKLCFITDCLPAGGLPDGTYTLGGSEFTSKGIECRLPDGTIAGSILKLNYGILNFYKNSDVPLYECVNCASLNPATALGIADKKGSIEVGKDADYFVCDDNFNVLKTIKGGKIIYEQ